MERLRQFVYGIIAGICIGIGGIVYLSCESPVVGSFLFSIGLLTICFFKLQLFTGKVGYIVNNKLCYIIELIITWAGNFVGTFLAGFFISHTRISGNLSKVSSIVAAKLSDNLISIFILSLFCGMLMFIAVDIFKNAKEGTVKIIGVVFPVSVFILSGFEHCIANMFYFTLADMWGVDSFLYIIIMTLGNSCGGIIIPLSKKIFGKIQV